MYLKPCKEVSSENSLIPSLARTNLRLIFAFLSFLTLEEKDFVLKYILIVELTIRYFSTFQNFGETDSLRALKDK